MRFLTRFTLMTLTFTYGQAMAQGPATQSAVRVDADFVGGNIIVDRINGDEVFLRPDRRDTPRWWFYWHFRVRGAAARTLTFSFTDGNPIGVRGPAISTDGGRSWAWLDSDAVKDASFRYRFAAEDDDVRFCFAYPYLEADWRSFVAECGNSPRLRQATLCRTRKGRELECLHLGRLDGKCTCRVLLTARHHACETMASYALEGVIRSVLKDPEQDWLREHVEFLIVPFVDKDGVEDGDQGKARAPHDPYMDYLGRSIYPGPAALREQVPGWSEGRLRIAIDLHCPSIRGGRHETIFLADVNAAPLSANLGRFSSLLESLRSGPLPYRAGDNLPYGKEWNTATGLGEGKSAAQWAAELPGIELSATLEIPYANARGVAVTPDSARALGRDLARTIRRLLDR